MAPLEELHGAVHRWHARAFQQGTKQVSMFAVAIPFLVITTIVVSLRIFVRLSLVQAGLGIDDVLMLLGTICVIGLSIANMICGWFGAGVHTKMIPPEDLIPLLKADYATRLLYVLGLFFVKMSILFFYLRLDPRKMTRYAVYFLMFNVAGLSIATFFILIFVCNPPSMFWDPVAQMAHPEKCMSQTRQNTFFNANGILNIVQDFGIYILPFPMLWKLQMPNRQKAALIALLAIGFVALAAGCVRYYYVLFLSHEDDIWWYMADSLNWCSIEIYTAIICGSASTFKALMKHYAPRFWGTSRRGGSNTPARYGYDQSKTGQFQMKPYGSGTQKSSTKNGKYGLGDLTTVEYGSEEAIVSEDTKGPGARNPGTDGILMKKEVTVDVDRAPNWNVSGNKSSW